MIKRLASCGLVLLALAAFECLAAQPSRQPDILLIMPDQMRGDCLSLLGHSAVWTPHLDELARQGTLFRRAYTTVPSCIPARYALLTGLHPQTSGVVGFAAKEILSPPLPELLATAGYTTVLVGRDMHQRPASGSCGYQRLIRGSTYIAGDHYDQFLTAAARQSGGIRGLVEELGLTNNGWQAKPWPLADGLHPTSWILAQSQQVVQETTNDQPLFLTASFYAPHPPLFPPERHFQACLLAELPTPARGDWVDWTQLTPQGDKAGHRVLLGGETLRRAQAGYFGLIRQLDAEMAPLIAAFRARSEQAGRPWVVVFTSDHGEMLGDHGYFRKCQPYEGSANIPLVIAGSAELRFQPGVQSTQPVCLEDILPTLLELSGVTIPAAVDGISLVPVLRGDSDPIRPWLHLEHAPCYSPAQAFHALVDSRAKYIWRSADGAEQLFDLQQDPREEHDLAQDVNHRPELLRWRERLVQRLADRPEGFSQDGQLIPGRPYRPLNSGVAPSQR